MKEADYWSEGPQTRALRDEIRRLTTAPDVVARQDQARAAATATVTPAEQRVKKANKNPALWDKNHQDHDAAHRELRTAVAGAETDDERAARADAPLSERVYARRLQPAVLRLGDELVRRGARGGARRRSQPLSIRGALLRVQHGSPSFVGSYDLTCTRRRMPPEAGGTISDP